MDLAGQLLVETGLLVSPTIFDRETFERWSRQQRPLVMDIARDGVPL
jgi:hypothetical protein